MTVKRTASVLIGSILVGAGSWGLWKIIDAGGDLAWVMKSFPVISIFIGVGLVGSAVQRRYPLGTSVGYVLLPNGVLLLAISTYLSYAGLKDIGEILAGFFAMVGIAGVVVALAMIGISLHNIGRLPDDRPSDEG
ncbi:hypothetical protein BRD00_06395 [Halobacteriales archaeon QS_8_69_26]|nr:MAG: hypothetical protein BRD00_06395 [Halobacteriales archaeon QS_8_69_26]